MVNILVTMEVKDFALLAVFERKAVAIMGAHGGEVVRAFECGRNEDGSGKEIHLLEFPSLVAFESYRSNPLLLKYANLRSKAIESTAIVISTESKEYA